MWFIKESPFLGLHYYTGWENELIKVFNIRSVIPLSLAHIIYLFCGDGKTAMCRARVTCTASVSLPLPVLLWNINLYMIPPRFVRARTNKVWKVELMIYMDDIDKIPTSGINSLGNRNEFIAEERSEKNQILHISSLTLILFRSLNFRADFSIYFAAFCALFFSLYTFLCNFFSNNFIKF